MVASLPIVIKLSVRATFWQDTLRLPMDILLVEDHTDTALMVKTFLADLGHEVTFVNNADEAYSACKSRDFDLLLIDVGLPGENGWDFYRRLKEDCSTPAIAMTGYAHHADVLRSEQSGFAAHLSKPCDLERLREVIERVAPGK